MVLLDLLNPFSEISTTSVRLCYCPVLDLSKKQTMNEHRFQCIEALAIDFVCLASVIGNGEDEGVLQ